MTFLLEIVSVLHLSDLSDLSASWLRLSANFLLIFSVEHLGIVMTSLSIWRLRGRELLSSVLHWRCFRLSESKL